MKRLAHVAIVGSAVALWTCTAAAQFAQNAPKPENFTIKVDGQTRRALLYPPIVDSPGGRAPVVLSFHGHGDTIQNFQYTDMHEAWPEALVLYVQGLPAARDGQPGWQVERGEDGDRDLKLVDAVLSELPRQFRIDPRRIYATGFSNGANFTYLLWAERPAVFAAYAPVAARMRPSVHPAQPKPILHVAGRQDPQIPFADQEKAIETARRVDGVTGEGKSCGIGCLMYGPSKGPAVMTWIHPGGHVYPTSTSERIARFFRDHPLGQP